MNAKECTYEYYVDENGMRMRDIYFGSFRRVCASSCTRYVYM